MNGALLYRHPHHGKSFDGLPRNRPLIECASSSSDFQPPYQAADQRAYRALSTGGLNTRAAPDPDTTPNITRDLTPESLLLQPDLQPYLQRDSSGMSEQPAAGVDRLDVVLDNVADKGDAAGKGALTELMFGTKGSQVTDGDVFTATFRPAGKDPITKVYHHAIHSTIGNTDESAGLTPEPSIRAAFDKVVEGLVLNLLLDLQKEERL